MAENTNKAGNRCSFCGKPEGKAAKLIAGREAFGYEGKGHLAKHHLYVCAQNSRELHRHITFRNYLRSHPDAAAEYSRVKEEAAQLYPNDIDAYMRHKAPCIAALYQRCGLADGAE